jgi:hypothetical protein
MVSLRPESTPKTNHASPCFMVTYSTSKAEFDGINKPQETK